MNKQDRVKRDVRNAIDKYIKAAAVAGTIRLPLLRILFLAAAQSILKQTRGLKSHA